jgi:putative acetyltransferase
MPDRINILSYESRHAQDFHDLNIAWVSRFFTVEDKDRVQLEDPEAMILDKGGAILMAEDEKGCAIGCVALIPFETDVLEIAKMAVDEAAQGRGVGGRLMGAAIEKAQQLGATELYLESNSALGPAVHLYERAGFRHLSLEERPTSPYERCDVYMRLDISGSL